ncbi:peptidoglycan-binding protein [Streptomyces sp. NPDC059076]|uniref:peptidoglycan-binding protein n=1 Tax=unclassified Streptomyces TaxID=2593676 RepID=UPI0036D1567E
MTLFHVAVDHLDPDTLELTTTYLGTVDHDHVEEVRAIAALDDTGRWCYEHPRQEGAFCVVRDDGALDVYVPVDAPDFRVREPAPLPKTRNLGGDLAPDNAQFTQIKASDSYSEADLSRGATGPAYIDGAIRFGKQAIGGAMDSPNNPPRMTWHTTESPAGKSYFYSIAAYLIRVAAEPQVIYDPDSDLLGQFGPLTQSGRALRNDGTRRTNREGKVNVQVEVLGRAKAPWTKGFDPAKKPNYRKLIAAGRAHGIPDVWPAGKPPATAAAATKRDRTIWISKGGHYGHSQVPGNDHWDPGGIDISIVPGKHTAVKPPTKPVPAKPKPTAPQYEPFPGAAFFHTGRTSPIVTAMGRRLVAEGCGRYQKGPGPSWTLADKASYAAWQRKCGYTGTAADGIPGKTTWDKLRVPNQL